MEENRKFTTGRFVYEAYTLTEILLVVGIILLISFLSILIMNPKSQLNKVYNVRRKQELAIVRRTFEDYYNDQTAYPKSSDICYDTPVDQDGVCSCHVCGLASSANPLATYMPKLYCDPDYPKQSYLYQYDCSADTPTWYRMCARLIGDPTAGESENYNYGIASGNIDINECNAIAAVQPGTGGTGGPGGTGGTGGTGGSGSPSVTPGGSGGPNPTDSLPPFCQNDPDTKYCLKDGLCNACGDFDNCRNEFSCDQPVQLFSDYQCSDVCE